MENGSSDFQPIYMLPTSEADYICDLMLRDLKQALYLLAEVFNFDSGSVYLPVSGKRNVFEIKESIGFSEEYLKDTKEIRIGKGFCGTALGLNEIRVTEDMENDIRYTRPLIKELGYKSFAAIPLDPEIGLINLASFKKRAFTSWELSMFHFIGKKLGALCLTRLKHYDAMRKIKTSERLNVLVNQLFQVKDINQIALVIVEECRVILSCSVSLLLFMSDELSFVRSAGLKKENLLTEKLQKGFLNYAQKRDIFVLSPESEKEPIRGFLEGNDLEKLYCFNIHGESGYMGTLCVGGTKNADPISGKDGIDAFRRIGQLLSIIIDRYLYNRQMTTLAILEEQNRISHELHDSMVNEIVSLQKKIEYVQNILSEKKEVPDTINEEFDLMFNIIGNLHGQIREVISGLRTFNGPNSFERSLKNFLIYYEQNNPVQLEFTIEPNLQLPQFTQLQVFRIIQEALLNIRKHSQAKNVNISVVKESSNLIVIVKDDGVGFDTNNDTGNSQKFGLTIMKERAGSINGQVNIESAPGCGTEVSLVVPL